MKWYAIYYIHGGIDICIKKLSEELIDFIKNSPTAFHAIDNISKRLKENGYEELLEGKRWNIKAGGKYFVTRNNSSIIALNIGTKLDNYSFNVASFTLVTRLHSRLKKMQR